MPSGTQGSQIIDDSLEDDDVEENKLYLFATDQSYNGNLGGRPGADAICQSNLTSTSLENYQTRAVLSYNSQQELIYAPVEFEFPGNEPIYGLSGVMVTTQFNNLFADVQTDILLSNSLYTAGILASNEIIWSGTNYTGFLAQTHCNGWTTGSQNASGTIGSASSTDQGWIYFQESDCNFSHRFLCIAFPNP